MPVRVRIGARFGLEGASLVDDQVHAAQHVGQHMVGFEQQPVRLQFERDVAIAEVVGGAQQIERRAMSLQWRTTITG